ncbi:MAG TPA: hypothetical protein GXZ92_04985 [Clostridiales bacterium]|nr:hypothetical protein [Clostridiales bacterium]
MSAIKTLLKMEIQNRFGKINLKDRKQLLKLLTTVIFSVAVFSLTLWGATIFFEMFEKAGLAYEALVIFFTVAFVFLLITNISSTIKVLYYKGDNEILMRFPVNGWEIFWAKTSLLILSQLLLTTLIVVPFLVAYSFVVQVSVSYYVSIPFILIFMVFVPFFLSNMLAIPFMHLSNRIRHKFGLIIIGLAVLMTTIFFVYTLIFERMVEYLKANQDFSVFKQETVILLGNMVKYFVPTKYFAGIMLGEFEVVRIIDRERVTVTVGDSRIVSYLVFGIILALSALGAYYVIKRLYRKTLLANIEVEGSTFTKPVKNKVKSIFSTLLYKEFVQVFRSINYSFQYFVLACAMPIMVFFCNRIAFSIGINDVGIRIIPGLTLLIMLIFNTIIISFSATSISREGNNFYHTKVMPVPIKTQLGVKFVMYNMVSFIANTITIAIIILTKQMSSDGSYEIAKPLAIYAIVFLVSVALTLISMKMDIIKPRFNLNGEGEIVTTSANSTFSIVFGFVVALVFGLLGMMVPYIFRQMGFMLMFYMLMGLTSLLFVGAVLFFFIKLNAAYNKIM